MTKCIYFDRQTEMTGCDDKQKKCSKCGFEYTEHQKRINKGLVQGENGLWHYVATKREKA